MNMTTHLNLLPMGYLRARLIRRRLALWAPVWLAVALLGAANWWSTRVACLVATEARQLREQRYEPVKQRMAQVNVLRRQISELHNRETMLDELSEPHPPLSGLALIGLGASQCDGRVRVHQMVLERNKSAAQPGRRQVAVAASTPGGRSIITLDGAGLDNQAIAAFVASLKASGAFLKVDLKGTVRSGDDVDAMRTFVVTCEY